MEPCAPSNKALQAQQRCKLCREPDDCLAAHGVCLRCLNHRPSRPKGTYQIVNGKVERTVR